MLSKKTLALLLFIQPLFVFSQITLKHVGVGYDISGRTAVNSAIGDEITSDSRVFATSMSNGGHMRQSSTYRFNLGLKQAKLLSLNIDLLQGSENFYGYKSTSTNESNISQSINLDLNMNSALAGGRLVLRANTDNTRRLYYHVGVGAEMLYSYNVYARVQENRYIYNRTTYQSTSTQSNFETDVIQNHSSANFIQQFGMGVRLAKDEKFYPLNQTSIELDVVFTNNFAKVNSSTDAYRTYGTGLKILFYL